ncbi:NtaA/DmoA family FMN-dependent monooxygenase [Gibbsiella quercinecans]|uniref:NtaA/DmoA family FMN-dependent monooxygenase n=1 Tax=Gibbsiella quercinecans TaxID=929813 RepID=UPI003A4DFE2D
MAQNRSHLHFNFHGNSSGEHLAAWRRESTELPARFLPEHYIQIAKLAEKGLFDAVFFAAGLAIPDDGRPVRPLIDPTVLIPVLAAQTSHIGFVATLSTTFNEPYNVARTLASLDHVCGGRIGWNIVTTYDEQAAANFGMTSLPDRALRYARAEEFVNVVCKLWGSWADDAVLPKRGGEVDINNQHIHPVYHVGRFFSVKGASQTPRTPQGRPVLFQAGGSPAGMALAARYADAVFSIGLELDQAQNFYRELKKQVVEAGRSPDDLAVLPGVYLYLGGTEAEAERKRIALLEAPGALEGYIKQLATRLGVQAEALVLDAPVPESILRDAESRAGSVGHTRALVASLGSGHQTLRQFIARQPVGGPHRVIIGTPEQAAATLADWFRQGAADGFNIGNLSLPELEMFVEGVVPILQKQGLFREGYSGNTLRHHLEASH